MIHLGIEQKIIEANCEELLIRVMDTTELNFESNIWNMGDVINGKYEIIKNIGEGGMGQVWKVLHLQSGKIVAVKNPKPELIPHTKLKYIDRSDFIYKRFLKEAFSWINLNEHPNIVTCYYVEKLTGLPRIFTEYVEGGDLRKYLESGNARGWKIILTIAIQIASGMAHAHRYGLIHRDLKPENILISRRETWKTDQIMPLIGILPINVMITDFGLVKQLVQDQIIASYNCYSEGLKEPSCMIKGVDEEKIKDVLEKHSSYSDHIGTEPYMSPEQWGIISSSIDKVTDVYSFGIILCELITDGIRPDELENAYRNIRTTQLSTYEKDLFPSVKDNCIPELRKYISELIKRYRNDCSDSLISLIVKCLQTNPQDRWSEEKRQSKFNYFNAIKGQLVEVYKETLGEPYYLIDDNKNSSLVGAQYWRIDVNRNSSSKYYAYVCYRRGVSLYNLEEYFQSINILNKSLDLDPSNINAYIYKGLALDELRNHNEAVKYYDKALEIKSNDAKVWYYKGNAVDKLGDHNEAVKYYDKALEIKSNDVDTLRNKGLALDKLGRHTEASKCIARAFELDPNVSQRVDILANNHILQNYEVISNYDESLEMDLDDTYTLNYSHDLSNKAHALYDMGKDEEARRYIDLSNKKMEFSRHRMVVSEWYAKGLSHSKLQNYQEAISNYDKALELDPNFVNAWLEKGNSFYIQGRYRSAIECYQKYLKVNPNNVNVLISIAISLDRLDKYSKPII